MATGGNAGKRDDVPREASSIPIDFSTLAVCSCGVVNELNTLEVWLIPIACNGIDCTGALQVGCKLDNRTRRGCDSWTRSGGRYGISDGAINNIGGGDLSKLARAGINDMGSITVVVIVGFLHVVIGHGGIIVTFLISVDVVVTVFFLYFVIVDEMVLGVQGGSDELIGSAVLEI